MIDGRRKAEIVPRAVHGRPLKRRESLGHKEGSADRDLAAAVPLFLRDFFIIGGRNSVGQVRDRDPVLLRFCREPQHEIELDLVPAPAEGFPGSGEDLLFRDALVDHIPEPLRSGLRRECQTAPADVLDPGHEVEGKGIYPQRRHLELHPVRLAIVRDIIHDLVNTGVIAGAQRTEKDVILSGVVQHGVRIGFYRRQAALPVGPVDHARLAEPAAADAAPLQLHGDPVLGDRDKRDQGLNRIGGFLPIIQVCRHLPSHPRRYIRVFGRKRSDCAGNLFLPASGFYFSGFCFPGFRFSGFRFPIFCFYF